MNFTVKELKPFGFLVEAQEKKTPIESVEIERLRQLALEGHLLLLRGFETFDSAESFAAYCDGWGEASMWPFGKVLELVEQDNPADHIFDNTYVPMHWDGMYRPQVPELQIFHCVRAPLPGLGGRTFFTNTRSVVENASARELALWKKAQGRYHRKMEFYHSRKSAAVVEKHPYRDYSVIRYNEPHRPERGRLMNPVSMEFQGVEAAELELFHRSLEEALYRPENFYAHEWQDGDVVVADNFTLLHGREAFASKSPRHIQRVQILSAPPLDNQGLESFYD